MKKKKKKKKKAKEDNCSNSAREKIDAVLFLVMIRLPH